jgi:outer membrane protein OmpA-like peptidoglycan-associated protein
MDLSERRANSIQYIISKGSADRISGKGFENLS